jgi:hypothetical protein
MRNRRHSVLEAVLAAVAGSLVGAALVGAHGDRSYLHTCHQPNGPARLIAPPDTATPCDPGEVLDEWVVQGPVTDGRQGARGPAGAAGTRGPAGRDGRPGPAYDFRIARESARATPGAQTVTARCEAGELALSGGWATEGGVTAGGGGRSGADAWTLSASAPAGAGAAAISVYVVCARAVTP